MGKIHCYAMYFMPYIVDSVVRSSTTKTWRPEMSPRPTEHSRSPRCAPPCAPCAPPVAFGIRLEAQNLSSPPRKVLILQPNMFIERGDCVSLTAQCNTARAIRRVVVAAMRTSTFSVLPARGGSRWMVIYVFMGSSCVTKSMSDTLR